jgi:fructoselysine-6-P-deglycase FrlB-like protein
MEDLIEGVVAKVVKGMQNKGGLKQIYLVGCGGSYGAFFPAKVFIETESKSLGCHLYSSNEFLHMPSAGVNENAIVIACSHTGNTPETVEVARTCKRKGISIIGITYNKESELAQACDSVLTYTFGDDRDVEYEKPLVELKLAAEILRCTEGYERYTEFMEGCHKIHGIVQKSKKSVEGRALKFAKEHAKDTFIVTLASGAAWGAAYMESICIFMEMQWIASPAIHTGEFFHGPFEVIEKDTPYILLVSAGKTRQLDERAKSFLEKYGSRGEILDALELGLADIDASVIDYFNHSLFFNTLSVFNKKLAEERHHPLSVRRYMYKVPY